MEIRIRHGKNEQSEAFARFHRVVCDQSFDSGGTDTGMTPSELMLSALGCCAMHCANGYMRAHNLGLENLELRISAEQGGRPQRLIEIGIEVDAPGLSTRIRDGLTKAIEASLLNRTLNDPPRVRIRMATQVSEGPPAVNRANVAP